METLAAAFALGFVAGISPGPLLTLVLSSTLERGFGAGARVAVAPVLTDGPILLLGLFVLKDLPPIWLTGLTLVGAGYLIWLGIQTVRTARQPLGLDESAGGGVMDLTRGMLVNALNPAPWLFWFTVGGPQLLDAWRASPLLAIAFLAIFFSLLVGCKVVFAWITFRGRRFLEGRGYRRLLVSSGLVLIGLGASWIWKALTAL